MAKAKTYKQINSMETDILLSDVDSMICELGRRNIIPLKKKNVIQVFDDVSSDMATVKFNGQHMMTGNNHDFHPGCHGGRLRVLGYMMGNPHWSDSSGLVELLVSYVKSVAYSFADSRLQSDTLLNIEYYQAKYTDSGNWTKKILVDTVIKMD